MANLDTMFHAGPDNNGNLYSLNMVVLRSRLGMTAQLRDKSSRTTANAFRKMKRMLEAKTAPGRAEGWRLEEVRHDPGSEFKGAFLDELAKDNIINEVGEVDRHTSSALIEGRHLMLQTRSAALAVTAFGTNAHYAESLHGELVRWSNTLTNHKPITEQQIKDDITPAMAQWGPTARLDVDEIFIWGSLAYAWIPLKDRAGKVSPRAVKGIWVGMDDETPGAHRILPFIESTNEVEFLGTVKCMRARVYDGVFPLHNVASTEGAPKPVKDQIEYAEVILAEAGENTEELGAAEWLRKLKGEEQPEVEGKE